MSWVLFALLAALTYGLYKYCTRENDFFEKRGVKNVAPSFSIMSIINIIAGREDGMSAFQRAYDKYGSAKIYGSWNFSRPMFIICDAELVKHTMIKYFDNFVNHDDVMSKVCDGIFAKSVLLLESDEWREMRNKLSPIFTSAKMKTMFHHLTSCTQDLLSFFNEIHETNGKIVINAKEVFGKFTAESISTTALGFKGNCIATEETEVYKLAKSIQEDFMSFKGLLKMISLTSFPTIAKLFGVQMFRQSTHDFFKKFVTDEITRRESEGITNANDVIQLLIQAKNGQLKFEDDHNEGLMTKGGDKKVLNWDDGELLAAQVFIFFFGGYETTSTLIQMISWELAMNQDVQKDLIKEVDEVVGTMDGKEVSYEALNKMKILEGVVNEALRKWPPIPFGGRTCNRDCTIETSDGNIYVFKKGDMISVPFRQIQYDPKNFPNPNKFDPYRWIDENKQNIVPGTFLTFGYGPRVCLGNRLAMLNMKIAVFKILSKYMIESCDETPKEITYGATPMAFKQTVYVELKPRK